MRKMRFLVYFILLLAAAMEPSLAARQPAIQARVFFSGKNDWLTLQRLSLDQIDQEETFIEIIADQACLDSLAGLGFKIDIIHPDLAQFYRSRMSKRAMGDYKTLAEIYAYVDAVIAAHPTIVSARVSIGETYEGRDIWAFKISDNPDIDEDEPEVFYNACIHSREVITPEILLNFIDHLTQNYGIDSGITDLVDNRELWFVPVVNPDGYYYNEITEPGGGGDWRMNRRINGNGTFGVDLNRNFGYQWGYNNIGSSPYPGSETYRGTGPFSEPETQALRDFAVSRNFNLILSLHSFSNLVIWPWGYSQIYTPDNDIFATFGDSMSAYNGYSPGPIWTLYEVNGGSDDWYYGEQTTKSKTIALTIEAGTQVDGFWPAADRIAPLVSENLGPCLFLARMADRIYRTRPPAVPYLTVAKTVPSTGYSVHWTHADTLNPAIAYELLELGDYEIVTDAANSFADWINNGFAVSSVRSYSLPYSFYSGRFNNCYIYCRTLDAYRVQAGDTLRFRTFYKIEADYDYAYVEVSTDGATYAPIQGNLSTTTNPQGKNRGFGITGISSGGWVEGLFDLSPFVGQEIYIRFTYITDATTTEEGISIDDVNPVGIFLSQEPFYPLTDTIHSFSGKTTGIYSYKVRARDAEQQWSMYSNRRVVYVRDAFVCGDANGDDIINLGDAVFIVNYIFKDGAPPDFLGAADANADGEINIGDAVYIVNFIFKDGLAPVCP